MQCLMSIEHASSYNRHILSLGSFTTKRYCGKQHFIHATGKGAPFNHDRHEVRVTRLVWHRSVQSMPWRHELRQSLTRLPSVGHRPVGNGTSHRPSLQPRDRRHAQASRHRLSRRAVYRAGASRSAFPPRREGLGRHFGSHTQGNHSKLASLDSAGQYLPYMLS